VTARDASHDMLASVEVRAALDAAFGRAWSSLAPRPDLSIVEWAETHREMSEEETALPGRYDMEETPALRGILMAASDPDVRRIIVQKSAQVGYTAGVACNVIGYHIHWRPSTIVAMFPREKSAKDFASEKLEPMIRATAPLAERVNLKTRAPGSGTTRRKFPGGLLKLVASNSPSDVKSTSGRVGIVEEPDDTSRNVKGQGNAIALLSERTKTYAPDDLQLIGGTPTAKETSLIVAEMRATDRRMFKAACQDCGEVHTPDWDHVHIPGLKLSDEDLALPRDALEAKWPEREVYGRARWEDAFYACPHCGSVWDDDTRIENIRRAARVPPLYGWEPTAESATPGFFLSELLSTFEGSRVPELARKFLVAQHALDQGDPTLMVAFWNSTRGLPWEYRGDLPEEDELRERVEPYAEWTCPAGALVPLMFVDVQHDRLAVTVWVVGRGEEMWLAYWGEVYGKTIVEHAGAWIELEQLMARTVQHANGAALPIVAVGIDSGDGQTAEAVYAFVRKHNREGRPVRATKGASDSVGRVEIWTPPKQSVDPGKKTTKAAKYGVRPRQIGAAKAKDLILGWAQHGGRVRLVGTGPGRMHWYEGVRDDFFEQLLGEMKIPSKHNPRVREWCERNDRRNEALDCTVGCVWLCRELKLHLRTARQWEAIESRVLRRQVLPQAVEDAVEAVVSATKRAPRAPKRAAAPSPAVVPAPEPAKPAVPPLDTVTPSKPQPAPDPAPARPINARKGRRVRGRFGGW
jgi:phage terminase large subunit GpA-like protein